MTNQVEKKFSVFFEKWMLELEEFVEAVTQRSQDFDEDNCRDVVNKITQHHKDYYTAKWASAHEDVLAFFNPVWLSPMEIVYSWMTGWKPSTIFRLVESLKKAPVLPGSSVSLVDLTADQCQKIEWLRMRVRFDENKVEREMERQQVYVADQNMVELIKMVSAIGEQCPNSIRFDSTMQAAMKTLLAGLERVVRMGDCVRLKTLKGILDALNPIQSMNFLAASAMLLIEIRKMAKERDAHLAESSNIIEMPKMAKKRDADVAETSQVIESRKMYRRDAELAESSNSSRNTSAETGETNQNIS